MPKQGELDLRPAKDFARDLLWPAVPFFAHAATSAAAFTLGLGVAQLAGYSLGVSSRTRFVSSAMGAAGVAFASACADVASRNTRNLFEPKRRRRLVWPQPMQLARDALVGALAFRFMGGSFRAVMPSDLRFAGSCARESLPLLAKGTLDPQYATKVQKRELRRMYLRYGCHHCGSRRGVVIGDHIPPNKDVLQAAVPRFVNAADSLLGRVPLFRGLASELRASAVGLAHRSGAIKVEQRLFPQCEPCRGKQATAVRLNRQVLVLNRYVKDWAVAGALVGLQYYTPPPAPPGGGGAVYFR